MATTEGFKVKKLTAAQLSEQVASAERKVSALTGALNDAEAEATASVADESAYQEATRRVSELKLDKIAASERLEHLRRAHDAERQKESEQVRDVFKQELMSRKFNVNRPLSHLQRKMAELRHEAEVNAIGAIDASIEGAKLDLQSWLKRLPGGLYKDDLMRLLELLHEKLSLFERIMDCGPCGEAEFLQSCLNYAARMDNSEKLMGPGAGTRYQEFREKHEKQLRDLKANTAPLEQRLAKVKGEIAAIESRL